MRNQFEQQLARLNRELITMGAQCENAIALATKSLLEQDSTLAEKAVLLEEEINQSEREIEGLCLKLLLHQQPVARDLRQISASLKMVTDMERIGDMAADISEIMLTGEIGPWDSRLPVEKMAQATIKMVTDSIEAFVRQDIGLAKSVLAYDDVVDDLFSQTKHAIVEAFGKGITSTETIVDLLMIAKYYERIGDHAENIAEWVLFAVTGIHKGEGEL